MAHRPSDGPIRILLVEDNPADVYLFREALTQNRLRCELTVCEDGSDAIDYVARKGRHEGAQTPDMIVLDLNLPRHDGKEVLRRIKEADGLEDVPVVVLTTSGSPRDKSEMYQLGASLYLRKKSDLDEFLRIGETIRNLWYEVT